MYFAAKSGKDTASVLLGKIDGWNNTLETNGYLDKLRYMWAAYHGVFYTDFSDSHQINFTGEQGELTHLPINHIRNFGQIMLNMTTSNRPSLQPRSTNTDYTSIIQTTLAHGLLDYYMREKRLEKYLKNAVEMAIVLGSGYVKMDWNATSGKIFDTTDDGAPIYEGDVEFSNKSPFDVIFDTTKEDQKHDWVMVRSFKNRYDLIAKFPEYKQELLGLAAKNEMKGLGIDSLKNDETDDVAILEFYHNKTEAMPNGRYIIFCDEKTVFIDVPLPYRTIPVYRISPSDIMGTPFGYGSLFDLLPVQDGLNMLYSTILTNQNATGIQNIFAKRGADIQINSLGGGLNIIEGNEAPIPLNLTSTPAEIFKFVEMLEKTAETISGVNSVSRGNPPPNLESGTALALIQSMTIQFMSGLQQQYVQLIEDVGAGLINMLKDFAAVPRIAAIVGEKNRVYMKKFKGEDLGEGDDGINRVIVDLGNPLSSTTAGRVEMAQQMLQMKLITTPEQFLQVINTGKLEVMTEQTTSQLTLVKGENEAMINGEVVPALSIDRHKIHIVEHGSILSDPSLRKDARLVKIVLDHIQEHINLLRTTNPDLLAMNSEQPLAPPGGAPIAPQMPENVPNTGNQAIPEAMAQPTPEGQMPPLPSLPQPPPPFENAPISPQQAMPPMS
jgi:hypothetical protein